MVFTSYTIEWYNFFQSSMSCFFILLITQFILDLMLYNSFTFLLFLVFTKSFIAVWLRSTRAANKRSNNAVASATCFTLRAMEKVNGASRSIAAVEHGLPRGGPVDTIRVGCAHSWGFVEFIGCMVTRKAEQESHIPNRAHNMSCEQWVKIANMIKEMPQDSRRLTAKGHHGLKK